VDFSVIFKAWKVLAKRLGPWKSWIFRWIHWKSLKLQPTWRQHGQAENPTDKHRLCNNDTDDVVQACTKYIDKIVAEQWNRFVYVMPNWLAVTCCIEKKSGFWLGWAAENKSAKTHDSNAFVPRDLQNKWVSRTHGGAFLGQVCYPSCIGFWHIVWINRQTHGSHCWLLQISRKGWTLTAKSNVVRKTAKETSVELRAVDQQVSD